MKIDPNTKHVSLNHREPDFYNNVGAYYDILLEQVPIFYWEELGIWCFTKFEDVNALMRDRRFGVQISHIATREELGLPPIREQVKPFYDEEQHNFTNLEPPRHTRLRKLIHKAFLARQIKQLRPRIEALTHTLIDQMVGKTEVDLLADFGSIIPARVISELLGVPATMDNKLTSWAKAMIQMYELDQSPAQEREAVHATQNLVAYFGSVITERRSQPQDDLVSYLIEVQESDDKLTEEEIISTCIAVYLAGYEASFYILTNGIYLLLNHRDQMERWQQDMSLTQSAVEELLRFDPPLHMFRRWVLEDVTYKGHHFPFGSKIGVIVGSANRDPDVFERPEVFDISRNHNPHISFGAGIHFCIGAPLVRLEMECVLPILLQRLPNMTLAAPTQYLNSYHFHGLESLQVNINA